MAIKGLELHSEEFPPFEQVVERFGADLSRSKLLAPSLRALMVNPSNCLLLLFLMLWAAK